VWGWGRVFAELRVDLAQGQGMWGFDEVLGGKGSIWLKIKMCGT
jgi:hypothetical protein